MCKVVLEKICCKRVFGNSLIKFFDVVVVIIVKCGSMSKMFFI